jgi:alkylresorcinol/alkylpyrone synthase
MQKSALSEPTVGSATSPAPRIAAAQVAVPPNAYEQAEVLAAFLEYLLRGQESRQRTAERISANSGVRTRHFSVPLERLADLGGFAEANAIYLETAMELGESVLRQVLADAGIGADEVDLIAFTSSTGIAVPPVEARLARRVGFREDVKRLPLFGLGCVAGAAGIARLHDYLRSWPDQVAVLLSIELCSLTFQPDDLSNKNFVGASLFADGAAAAVAVGGRRAAAGPELLSTRSRLYPDTERLMGWDIATTGFRLVLSADIPTVARDHLSKDIAAFLADHGLGVDDIATWVAHPGGPKVIDATVDGLGLPDGAMSHTRASLARYGNMSSASVLDVLRRMLAGDRPASGAPGLLLALGPGFCSELVLLRW